MTKMQAVAFRRIWMMQALKIQEIIGEVIVRKSLDTLFTVKEKLCGCGSVLRNSFPCSLKPWVSSSRKRLEQTEHADNPFLGSNFETSSSELIVDGLCGRIGRGTRAVERKQCGLD